jgi:hypothetical protein
MADVCDVVRGLVADDLVLDLRRRCQHDERDSSEAARWIAKAERSAEARPGSNGESPEKPLAAPGLLAAKSCGRYALFPLEIVGAGAHR